MSILRRLKDYLDREKVPYEVLTHRETFTAPELAQALHVPGRELAKVVMVKADERFVMTVLPANWKVDLKRLKEIFGPAMCGWRPKQSLRNCSPIANSVQCRLSAISTAWRSMWTSLSQRTRRSSFRPGRAMRQ